MRCAVTADLNRYLDEQDKCEALGELIDARIDEKMGDHAVLAGALDELMACSHHNNDGNTIFAADLANVLLASDDAFGGECIRFFLTLRERARAQLHDEAECDVMSDQDEPEDV